MVGGGADETHVSQRPAVSGLRPPNANHDDCVLDDRADLLGVLAVYPTLSRMDPETKVRGLS